MKNGMGIVYVAWFAFVFAMCYFFSPWFVVMILFQIIFKVFEQTLEFLGDIVFHKIRCKIKSIAYPVIIEKIEYKAIIAEIKRRLSK